MRVTATSPDVLLTIVDTLAEWVKDAKREYADEVDTVEEAMSDLGTSLDAAVSGPTGPNIAAVGAASQALGTSIKALVDSVDSTC